MASENGKLLSSKKPGGRPDHRGVWVMRVFIDSMMIHVFSSGA